MDGVEVFRLADIAVKHTAADAADVVAGAPTLGTTAVTTLGDSGVEIGVWEMSVGAVETAIGRAAQRLVREDV